MSEQSAPLSAEDVIYDWNRKGDIVSPPLRKVEFVDETLRDGIQCPSVTDPPIDAKKQIVRLLDAVGVNHCDIGLPGAGPRAVEDVKTLARVIRDEKLAIKAPWSARTHPNDLRPIIAARQDVGLPIEVMTFLVTAPTRSHSDGSH